MVALSHFGTRVTAGEIDIRVVKGWSVVYTRNKDAAREVQQRRSANASAAPVGSRAPQESSPVPRCSGATGLEHLVSIGLAPDSLLHSRGAQAKTHPNPETTADQPETGEERDIFTNFVHYGLPNPEVVICDNSVRPWRIPGAGWVDCIVTDPPYGVRAASKKQGRKGDPVDILDGSTFIASKVRYGEDELNQDLMQLAADALVDHGRFVFLLPVDLADFLGIDRAEVERNGNKGKGTLRDAMYPDAGCKRDKRLIISETTRDPLLLDEARYLDFLPQHRCLELVGASLQVLSGGLGRLLVTMQRRPRGLCTDPRA